MNHPAYRPDPKLDLVLERVVDVPPELVWAAWTEPEHLMHWFTPLPWKTVACKIDLRPGGLFHTVMESPEGKQFPSDGCYLAVEPNRMLAWTNVLAPGFRPTDPAANRQKDCFKIFFTAVISLEPHGAGTKYTALVMHRDEQERNQHEKMGFNDGWGTALDQLVAYMKGR
ncbi:MAG: SRPBCC family protein [Betaproteobacteria bacterium]